MLSSCCPVCVCCIQSSLMGPSPTLPLLVPMRGMGSLQMTNDYVPSIHYDACPACCLWCCLQSSLMGPSLTLPIAQGRFALGTWQGIYLNEHRWAQAIGLAVFVLRRRRTALQCAASQNTSKAASLQHTAVWLRHSCQSLSHTSCCACTALPVQRTVL